MAAQYSRKDSMKRKQILTFAYRPFLGPHICYAGSGVEVEKNYNMHNPYQYKKYDIGLGTTSSIRMQLSTSNLSRKNLRFSYYAKKKKRLRTKNVVFFLFLFNRLIPVESLKKT